MALLGTLQDNFDDGQRDPSLWVQYNANVAEQNGYLYCTTDPSTTTYSGYETKNYWDLTSSSVFVQVISAGDQSISTYQCVPIKIGKDNQNSVAFIITGNKIVAQKQIATVYSNVKATDTYVPATHKYFRIRESAGTTYWDYSSDGTTWVNYTSLANPWTPITAVVLDVIAGNDSTGVPQTTAIFDNVNITPVADHSRDDVRQITQSTQVSWKKDFRSGIAAFTIGSSSIGGTDFIGSPSEPVTSAWNKYKYFDESDYVLGLGWERTLQMPLGGLSVARADVKLDNNSLRFLPDFMGGRSELYTAMLPRRPMIINAGFHYNGVDNNWPAFIGVLDKSPTVDIRNRQVQLSGLDFLSFLQNKRVDNTAMYTGQRLDQILDDVLHNKLGFATSQYVLDQGTQTIPFASLDAGAKLGDFINNLAQGELGHVFQDESGLIRFWNRYKWNTSPYNYVSTTIYTADVIQNYSPDEDHLINVVEISATPLKKSTSTTVYTLPAAIQLQTGRNEIFLDFDNPVILVTSNSFTANSASDGSGTNDTGSVILKSTSVFTKTAKYIFDNQTGRTSYLTVLTVTGRWATAIDSIYRRNQDDSSVTAYEERTLSVNNDYIQSEDAANNYARYILDQYSEPESIIKLTIRAIPTLKNGDLVSWQGTYWRLFGIQSSLDPGVGYIQTLTMAKRTTLDYFTIGVSTIGSASKIAP